MKIPVTDKFLLDVYKAIDFGSRVFDYAPPAIMKEGVVPFELRKLRKKYQREQGKRQFSQLLYYLKKNGYIRISEREKTKQGTLLTLKGKQRMLKAKKRYAP